MQVTIAYNHFGEGLIQRMPRVETAASQWKGWNWRSEGDLLLNGAYFTPSGAGASASYARASSLGAKSSSMVGSMTSGAGALGCRRGRQC
ncbi:putative pectate lyase 8 [Senna tora]|uniref:Putative pectate lyase 8 n=1 Tax=Senna tora TaxID=362788 RepID=A0A834X2V6_9FABA|nr:putative pectate lyase 8 [Senna tora]